MSESFSHFLAQSQQRINRALERGLGEADSPFSTNPKTPSYLSPLFKAMSYSLLNGGKRIRPVLVYAAAQAIAGAHQGGDENGEESGEENESILDSSPHDTNGYEADELDKVAAAVEMVHAYSLIHDDLPAMDDDDLRRGQPSCHKAFDEATAILAGDALQARAFGLLTGLHSISCERQLQLIAMLSTAAGARGMVGGQIIDLHAVDQVIDINQLETLHQLKTGALIRAAITMGATFAGANETQMRALDYYAQAIGLAFQVQDDILDIESDTATLGKIQGSDLALNKPTYPSLLGLEQAKSKARELHQQALAALQGFDHRAQALRDLADYIIARRH